MADPKHDIDVLNSLLATVVDSIDGSAQATQASDNARYNAISDEVATSRRAIARDLKVEIAQLGGTPEEGGRILGSVQRVFIELRNLVSSGDIAVVDEANAARIIINGKFQKTADDDALTPESCAFVVSLSERVRAGNDRIRDLKHELHADA